MMQGSTASTHIPTHVTRDTIQFNKQRAEICGEAYNKSKFQDVLQIIHNSIHVRQLNSVPKNTLCAVDNVSMPVHETGIQLICQSEQNKIQHIVMQKKYQMFCNSYFKLRHFTDLLQHEMRMFFIEQPWYIPEVHPTHFLLQKLFSSTFVARVQKDLTRIVETLEGG